MAAPKGNQFWEARSSHGRSPKFETAEVLWDAAVEYFNWVEDNPLQEAKLFKIKGSTGNDEIIEESFGKMRAMTLDGLHLFLGITDQTWINYRDKQGFLEVTTRIDKAIRSQKFSGAAADLLNANIIARDLGLKDASKTEHIGTLGVIDMKGWSDEQVEAYIASNSN